MKKKYLALSATCFGMLIALVIFLTADFLYSNCCTFVITERDRPQTSKDNGWYELKNNFFGKDSWGNYIFDVRTDEIGFRTNEKNQKTGNADYIFLGDSFTYGVNGPWGETYVGMFDESISSRILNAGVGSYSVTPYIHQYKKALASGLLNPGHVVVLAVDVSDVYDEANEWRSGPQHPVKRHFIKDGQLLESPGTSRNISELRISMQKNFSLTREIYQFLRYRDQRYCEPEIGVENLYKTAFTWMPWDSIESKGKWINGAFCPGFYPVSVKEGIERLEVGIFEISEMARKSNAKIYFLIYPHPAQIVHDDKFSWSELMKKICQKTSCDGVIDTTPDFKDLAKADPSWGSNIYVDGDIHFTAKGNGVIAKKLIEKLPRAK
jgi:hypothetical protein